MNFLNLEYFIVTAEEMNFTRATKRLYISQPSLSNHIAKLEEEAGVRLFDRNPPMTLTEAGWSFLRNARRMMAVKEEAEMELQDIKDFKSAILTIGVTNIRGSYTLPPLLDEFKKRYPRTKIRLVEGTTGEITEELYKGKVDLTIGHKNDDPEKIKSEDLQEESLLIVVSDSILKEYFSESQQKKLLKNTRLPIGVFADCPFVKMKSPNWIGELFDQTCREGGVIPEVVLETDNITTLVSMCKAGYGVGISPAIFVKTNSLGFDNISGGETHSFILDFPGAERTIAANYLKNKYQTRVARQFIEMAKEIMV